jgi:DNA-directed RNA polymerase specialized sigma24 family protein
MAAGLSASFHVPDPRTQNLSALHARFAAPLQRFFRSCRLSAADVEDLTQDVFVRLASPGTHTELRNPNPSCSPWR